MAGVREPLADRAAASSDDEAPEEVSNTIGRDAALNRLQSEHNGADNVRAAQLERRRQQRERAAAAKREAPSAQLDVLPTEVLAALANHDGREGAELSDDGRDSDGQVQYVEKKRPQRALEVRAGPVAVRVLDDTDTPAASSAALHFLKQRQAAVKRSADMLLPPAALRARKARAGLPL